MRFSSGPLTRSNTPKSFTDNVEFSAEDGSRSDRDFLCRVFEAAIDAGATTVNLPDTVGYAIPEEFADLVRYVIEHTPNIDQAVLSVHCHNDLGLATANTLAAIRAGARQAEVTLNGIGERAGNTSLGRSGHGPAHPAQFPAGQHRHQDRTHLSRPAAWSA